MVIPIRVTLFIQIIMLNGGLVAIAYLNKSMDSADIYLQGVEDTLELFRLDENKEIDLTKEDVKAKAVEFEKKYENLKEENVSKKVIFYYCVGGAVFMTIYAAYFVFLR
jgi:hypothetical protein